MRKLVNKSKTRNGRSRTPKRSNQPAHRPARYVRPPEGEMARVTLDWYRQNEDDIGSVKITTSVSDNSAMSYDIHIPGLKPVLVLIAKFTAKSMMTIGGVLLAVGQFLQYKLNDL